MMISLLAEKSREGNWLVGVVVVVIWAIFAAINAIAKRQEMLRQKAIRDKLTASLPRANVVTPQMQRQPQRVAPAQLDPLIMRRIPQSPRPKATQRAKPVP